MQHTNKIASIYKELQQQMCRQLEEGDGKAVFQQVPWTKDIGSGLTCVMKEGNVIEKAGLNFSHVEGDFSPKMEAILGMKANKYSATGISSIIHPYNPFMPIIHMNVRYFELDNGTSWFGGGIDLTPHYINKAQATWFHQILKDICDKYDKNYYPDYKTWADNYFFNKHRNETRGVGGIFFDRIQPKGEEAFENFLAYTIDLAKAYPNIYCDLMEMNKSVEFNEVNKQWQALRRGRYVEYNLVYDRGTKFGLESGGNTESILVSMPPMAQWEYNFAPEADSAEQQTLDLLKKELDWVNMK
ncbi:oxygen-dependent coproporphyrinogen oxidase [Labilibacter marinus]|uniref:oxygen-dependent coproporphyrinogen oxidase n=1 Tax=Labilibacter marinus TaxID=1477105 RepID=UPI00094F67B2|nr:oxygen-dependent coproporphyrinogen oxidase [Labilibacter marinus]